MVFGPPLAAVLAAATILSLSLRAAEPAGNSALDTKMFSVPVSPSVVATVANRDGALAMLALWRGRPKWYGGGTARSSSSGGNQDGSLRVSVQYGSVDLSLIFEPAIHTATLHGTRLPVPKGSNVFLIDGADQPGGGKLIKAFYLDPAGANLELRFGLKSLIPLLTRSDDVVAFLECDKWPQYLHSAEPCTQIGGTKK